MTSNTQGAGGSAMMRTDDTVCKPELRPHGDQQAPTEFTDTVAHMMGWERQTLDTGFRDGFGEPDPFRNLHRRAFEKMRIWCMQSNHALRARLVLRHYDVHLTLLAGGPGEIICNMDDSKLGAESRLEGQGLFITGVPGKPVAYYSGLHSVNYGLLWSIVACYFGLLGVPGKS